MARYAAKTEVSPERSRAEIERVVVRYGARAFMAGWQGDRAAVQFEAHGRRLRFVLPLPRPGEYYSRSAREQAERQRWRALLLAIKAKLEAVESGIASFEEEFAAYLVLADGSTVGEWLLPQLDALDAGRMPPLLPGPRGDG